MNDSQPKGVARRSAFESPRPRPEAPPTLAGEGGSVERIAGSLQIPAPPSGLRPPSPAEGGRACPVVDRNWLPAWPDTRAAGGRRQEAAAPEGGHPRMSGGNTRQESEKSSASTVPWPYQPWTKMVTVLVAASVV